MGAEGAPQQAAARGSDQRLLTMLHDTLRGEGGVLGASELLPLCPQAKRLLCGRKLLAFAAAHPDIFVVDAPPPPPGSKRADGPDLAGKVVLRLAPGAGDALQAELRSPTEGLRCRLCGGCFASRNKLYRHLELCDAARAGEARPRPAPTARLPGKKEAAEVCKRVRQVVAGDWRPAAERSSAEVPLRWMLQQRKLRAAVRAWMRTLPTAAGEAAHEAFSEEWYQLAARRVVVFLRERPEQFTVVEHAGGRGPAVGLTEQAAREAAAEAEQRLAVTRVEQQRAARKAADAARSEEAAAAAAAGAKWQLYSWRAGGALLLAAAGAGLLRAAAAVGRRRALRTLLAAVAGAALLRLLHRQLGPPPPSTKAASLQRWLELPAECDDPREKKQKGVKGRFIRWVRGRAGGTRPERQEQLAWASEAGDLRRLQRLMAAGVHLDGVDQYGRTAAFIAAFHGRTEALKVIAAAGADLSIPANGGATALSCAAARGDHAAVGVLTAVGQPLCQAGSEGLTAEDYLQRKDDASGQFIPPAPAPSVEYVVPLSYPGEARGSFIIDRAVSSEFVEALQQLWQCLPAADVARDEHNERRYFCDAEGWVSRELQRALRGTPCPTVMPQFRFLHYSKPGQALPPHTDLYHTDPVTAQRSTHTLILYLCDCASGETALLPALKGPEAARPLACVAPRRGRLLLFPHLSPHEGRAVATPPKLLLRGEAF